MGVADKFVRDNLDQFIFHLPYGFARGKLDAVCQSIDVCVHSHRWFAEGGV